MKCSGSVEISESDVTRGIFHKHALEFPRVMSPMGFSGSFGISKSDVTHGIFHQHALDFLRVMSPAPKSDRHAPAGEEADEEALKAGEGGGGVWI